MKVYLVSRGQGEYDDCRFTNIGIFQSKEKAELYVVKAKELFPKLHDFYYSIYFSELSYEHPLGGVAFMRWRNYETADFYIQEFELR